MPGLSREPTPENEEAASSSASSATSASSASSATSEPNEKRARADVLATLAIITATGLAVFGPTVVRRLSAHPSKEQCEALLDRYEEHVAYAVDPKPSASALAERRALARAAATGRTAFSRCVSDLTLDEAECAMKANGADEFERCLPAR